MPISHQFKLIFIHVPKTGGSSVVRAITEGSNAKRAGDCMDYWGKIKKGKFNMKGLHKVFEVEWPYARRVSLFHHLPAYQLMKLIDNDIWDNYYKFAVIRNPFDRYVSFYEYYRGTGGRLRTGEKSFEEWFWTEDFFPAQWPYVYNPAGGLLVDKIIRFEDISSEFKKVCEDLKIPFNVMPHEKKSERKSYQEYFTRDMRICAEKLVRRDLELFGYKF